MSDRASRAPSTTRPPANPLRPRVCTKSHIYPSSNLHIDKTGLLYVCSSLAVFFYCYLLAIGILYGVRRNKGYTVKTGHSHVRGRLMADLEYIGGSSQPENNASLWL